MSFLPNHQTDIITRYAGIHCGPSQACQSSKFITSHKIYLEINITLYVQVDFFYAHLSERKLIDQFKAIEDAIIFLTYFLFLLKYSWFAIMLVLSVQQSNIYICIYFFQIIFHISTFQKCPVKLHQHLHETIMPLLYLWVILLARSKTAKMEGQIELEKRALGIASAIISGERSRSRKVQQNKVLLES